MANLYDEKWRQFFDAMYQTFINYDEEYQFYNHLITQLVELVVVGKSKDSLK
jgi:hypothetical protein